MKDIYRIAPADTGLTPEEIKAALLASLEGRSLKKVLILPPDFTRFHSNAGFITNVYYHALTERGESLIPVLRGICFWAQSERDFSSDDLLLPCRQCEYMRSDDPR